jgi:bacteriocin biosynthesis cyclodehydratase domain-containing protein
MLKPLLSRHYSVWVDPPDDAGDEVLHIVSEQRTLKLKGFAFREFRDRVVPLLDGTNSVDAIVDATRDVFSRDDLVASLSLLADHGIVVEGHRDEHPDARPDGDCGDGAGHDGARRMAPQLNLFRELVPDGRPDERLRASSVAVIGLGGVGTACALALAAAGVGTIRCIDALPVVPADVYLGPAVALDNVGRPRADVAAALIGGAAPGIRTDVHTAALGDEDDLRVAIADSDLVVCCLDAAQSNTIYKLNRVCLAADRRWITCAAAGAEVVVGPLFVPRRTACYMCYRMRTIACAGNPEDAFKYERRLDATKRDDSDQRANLVFGAAIAANLVALESVKVLSGVLESALVGRILTIRLTDLAVERHTVLRKPWCPACFGTTDEHEPTA